MNFKICNTCHRSLPENKEHFFMRLKAKGIWGTTAKCRRCQNATIVTRRAERKEQQLVHEITKLLAEQADA